MSCKNSMFGPLRMSRIDSKCSRTRAIGVFPSGCLSLHLKELISRALQTRDTLRDMRLHLRSWLLSKISIYSFQRLILDNRKINYLCRTLNLRWQMAFTPRATIVFYDTSPPGALTGASTESPALSKVTVKCLSLLVSSRIRNPLTMVDRRR